MNGLDEPQRLWCSAQISRRAFMSWAAAPGTTAGHVSPPSAKAGIKINVVRESNYGYGSNVWITCAKVEHGPMSGAWPNDGRKEMERWWFA